MNDFMRCMSKYFFQLVILLSFYISFSSFEEKDTNILNKESYQPVQKTDPLFLSIDTVWVDSVLSTLSLEEKIAQTLMIAVYSNKGEDHVKYISGIIEKHNIGGLIFFQGGPVRQAEMTNHFQSVAKTPLLIAMDAEWGLGMRLDSTISYPRQLSLGALRDDELIYQMGYNIGRQMKRLGVHMNFAPVADINNNRLNPVINYRSFGENRINVALKAYNYARGLEDAGIIPTLKHFPGHGDTDSDSHYTLPVLMHSKERLDSVELFPFRYCISNGVPAIMSAHLNIPALDSASGLASSLSEKVITKLLKDELDFKGLVISDALSMKGVSDYFKPGELEVLAFKAGNDILLMPSDVEKAINFIKKEIRRGNIMVEEVDERCKKILKIKYWAGAIPRETTKTDSLTEELNSSFYKALKWELIRGSLTVIKNEDSTLPLKNNDTLRIFSLTIGADGKNVFSGSLKLYNKIESLNINKSFDNSELKDLRVKLSDYNTLIISIENTSNKPVNNFGITAQTIQFINELKFHGKTILCIFGNPYSIDLFGNLQNINAVIVAYEDEDDFKYLAAQGIFGSFKMNGALPVSANNIFPSSTSEYIPGIQTLSYGFPEEVLVSSETLNNIDSIANDAIKQKATPGCQILVARYGKVIFHKAYGFHSYDGKKKVELTDIYDLASITKIAATLPLLMQLYEKSEFDLDQNISSYLPEFDTTNKANLSVADILAHQAGLQAWIPFYYSLLETLDSSMLLFSNKFSADYPLKIGNNLYINKNIRLKENTFRTTFSPEFPLQVTDGIYLHKSYRDTVYQSIMISPIGPLEKYLYSDIGNYLFHRIIENITGELLYPLVYKNFYSKIGACTLGFLPLNRFPKEQIVPTENDLIFRKQLIQGYVHDPGAAMLGGISGHAGLFSNANDLAKMMQLFLNGGYYGGHYFMNDSVVNKFTACYSCNNGNRRGLGFDKPEPDPKKNGPSSKLASPSSFGHTGFTGTIVWMDPEYGLLYIFLSNRIHPDQYNQKLIDMNVRTKIHDIIYNSLLDVRISN